MHINAESNTKYVGTATLDIQNHSFAYSLPCYAHSVMCSLN
jgi:hypothetical protein